MPKGLSIFPLPRLQPRMHALVVRAAPVDSSACRAMTQRFVRTARVLRDARGGGFVGGDKRGVVDQAAGEGMGQPVDMEACADQFGQVVQRRMRQDQRDAVGGFVFGDQRVLRQEIAAFFAALPQQLGIALAAVREQRVVAGGAQVAAQVAQHFVAEEAGLAHAAILNPNEVGAVFTCAAGSNNG